MNTELDTVVSDVKDKRSVEWVPETTRYGIRIERPVDPAAGGFKRFSRKTPRIGVLFQWVLILSFVFAFASLYVVYRFSAGLSS
ncbi:MAG: hypothetical protein NC930_01710 [Candidatus Omnitrophica bacterium]|nr:hypothetical protein [Candidatus Omnitrophota bacterium]